MAWPAPTKAGHSPAVCTPLPKLVTAARETVLHLNSETPSELLKSEATSELLEAELSPVWRGRHTLMMHDPLLIGDVLHVQRSNGRNGEEVVLTVEVPSVVDTIQDELGPHYPNDALRHYHFLPRDYASPFSQRLRDFLGSEQSANWVFDAAQSRSKSPSKGLDNPILSIKGAAGYSLITPEAANSFYVAFKAKVDALLAGDGLVHGACQRQKRALYYLANRILPGQDYKPGGVHVSTTCSCEDALWMQS